MSDEKSNDPLHGVTLQAIVEALVERHGWPALGQKINIRCFSFEPSIKSSLKFLRKTVWARQEVEKLYLQDLRRTEKNRQRNRERAARRAHGARDVSAAEESQTDSPDPEVS